MVPNQRGLTAIVVNVAELRACLYFRFCPPPLQILAR